MCAAAELSVWSDPLKGGKSSTLEGGVRVSAFASGGMIPPHMRGKVFSDPSQMIHVCDCALYDLWCLLVGKWR